MTLPISALDRHVRREACERQRHRRAACDEGLESEKMRSDHIKPWSRNDRMAPGSCRMPCHDCNLKKGTQK